MTGRAIPPIPPPPSSVDPLALARSADTSARELLSEDLFAVASAIPTCTRTRIGRLLDDLAARWGAWSALADRLEAELTESAWPTEEAA